MKYIANVKFNDKWNYKNLFQEGNEKMDYKIGDIIEMKKQHPCGNKKWEITRVGVDFKFKCIGCDHVIAVPREKALKMIKKRV